MDQPAAESNRTDFLEPGLGGGEGDPTVEGTYGEAHAAQPGRAQPGEYQDADPATSPGGSPPE